MARRLETFRGIFCAFLGVSVAGGAEPAIRAGHPRIYLAGEDVAGVRARCAGPMKGVFQAMQKAEWIMKRRAGTDWSDMTNASYPAFLYVATGRGAYLAKTKEFLAALARTPPRETFLTPEWIRTGTMACDWVWNDLTGPERARYGTALVRMAEWVLAKVWRHSDFNNHFVNEHLAVLYPAVLLSGEGIEAQAVARLMKIGHGYLVDHAVPAANEIAGRLARQAPSPAPPWGAYLAEAEHPRQAACAFVGGQAEGFSYNDWGYARPLALTCEMWRVATGQDFFRDSSFFRGQSIWHAYGLRPDTGSFARGEDCPSGYRPGENLKALMHLLGGRCRDGLAEHLARQVPWQYVQKGWQEILWRDPTVQARSPRELSLPLAGCFPKLGQVYFRTAWGRADSAFALFQCGPFYAGHQHLDNNTFVIHRLGSLAIDSGTNDYGTHRGNYYCRTVAHNGVLVFDPAETFSGAAWSSGGDRGSNDGGQMRGTAVTRVGTFRPGGPSDVGRLAAFGSGSFCAGCVGDATRSYSPRKVSRALRCFLHLRPGPKDAVSDDTFVVYDYLEPAGTAKSATWGCHSIDPPKIEGDHFVITRGGGRLVGQVIWPENPRMNVVGGPGREHLVDGRNYPPTQKKPDPEAGAWRIELPFSRRALVVLHAGAKTSPLPPAVRMEGMGGSIGFRVAKTPLRFDVKFGKSAAAPPWVEVFEADKCVETLKLGG